MKMEILPAVVPLVMVAVLALSTPAEVDTDLTSASPRLNL